MCGKRSTTNEYNHDLACNNDELYDNEKVIPVQALEYVQLVVEPPVVVLIEYLHPNKSIENQCLQLILLAL
jgi:hypothetical protein